MIAPLISTARLESLAPSSSYLDLPDAPRTSSGPLAINPWKPRPVLGGQKTLVLLVQFSDVRFSSSISEIRTLVGIVDEWFRESSYGKVFIDYTIYEEVLTLPRTMASYGAPEQGASRGDDPARLDAYVIDTLDLILSETDMDLMSYKSIVIVHSGDDEASATGNPNEIWSFCACEGPYADESPEEASWKLFDESGQIVHTFWGVSTFSEDEPWSIFVHEFSHSLGLSDLYVYGSDNYSEGSGVGLWSMMDMGAILDPPSDIDGWSKYILGWVEPSVVVDPSQGEYMIYTLDSANDPKALIIRIGADENEYYFIHARRIMGTDAALPSEGVVVFKIDATRERSYRGYELAAISDANSGTPPECSRYADAAREGCETLDAPYNEKGKRYSYTYGLLSMEVLLNNDIFWDQEARIGFSVQAAGDGAFWVRMGLSPEQIPTTTTEQTTVAGPQCVIATAAYGSELRIEVEYMRHVRDELVGSSRTGMLLVGAWNAFYYTWSPEVARVISGSEFMQAIFRILLLPLIAIVHLVAQVFWTVFSFTGISDIASVSAFVTAAFLSIGTYAVLPVLTLARLLKKSRHWRMNTTWMPLLVT
jgi:M6 family metalloprotease-like protein